MNYECECGGKVSYDEYLKIWRCDSCEFEEAEQTDLQAACGGLCSTPLEW